LMRSAHSGSRIYPSAVTEIFVPSDTTLMAPGLMFRLLAVSHQPVGALLPPSTLNPFSSSRFCVPHISDASEANSVSSSLIQSLAFAAICVGPCDAAMRIWQRSFTAGFASGFY
jgi:hypothetical protein